MASTPRTPSDAVHRLFTAADPNHDGRITAAESKTTTLGEAAVTLTDGKTGAKHKDGAASHAELLAYVTKFAGPDHRFSKSEFSRLQSAIAKQQRKEPPIVVVKPPPPPPPPPRKDDPLPIDGIPPITTIGASNADGYALASAPTSGQGGGQTDSAGNLYVAMPGEVRIFDASNHLTKRIAVAGTPSDVAPSPDGSSLYVAGPQADGTRAVSKYVRGADGSYAADPSFHLESFQFGGKEQTPEGFRITTDAQGSLYVADGMWTKNGLNTVVKYDASGKFQTRFGSYVDGNPGDASSWDKGRFYWGLAGIAVSPDGQHVYTTEVGNNRVQRWDVQADGSYEVGTMWGNTQADDPNRQGSMAPGKFAAPYDIGVDPAGSVYVMNTTVNQMQKFTADGQFVTAMDTGSAQSTRSHGIAVTARGDALDVETGRMMQNTGALPVPVVGTPAPLPVPGGGGGGGAGPVGGGGDTVAPTLNGFSLPASVAGATVPITIDASDDHAVSEVRLATEDGNWGPWQAFSPDLSAPLSAGVGTKGVFVQVRDAAGNESGSIYHTTTRTA